MSIIGIDLGTTYSSVAVWKNGETRVIPTSTGKFTIPSAILHYGQQGIFTGWDAKKRHEGITYDDQEVSWHYLEGTKRQLGKVGHMQLNGNNFTPQYVAAYILTTLKLQAEEYLEAEVNEAVIAIPSHFNSNQRHATIEAAGLCGLEVKRLINEASATALAYGYQRFTEETTLVFDFGGGTLDLSVVDISYDPQEDERLFDTRYINGRTKLGGVDFNHCLEKLVLQKIKQQNPGYKPDKSQKTLLNLEIEKAKIVLSGSNSVAIPVFALDGINTKTVSVTRKEFEQASAHIFDSALELLKDISSGTNQKILKEVDTVLAVGGSSNIPAIKTRIQDEIGIRPAQKVNIETAAAEGAALQGAIMSKEEGVEGMVLIDINPSNLGIQLDGSLLMEVLVDGGKRIPCKVIKGPYTTSKQVNSLFTELYQGNDLRIKNNDLVGTLTVDLPIARGNKLEFHIKIDKNGIITADVKDLQTHQVHKGNFFSHKRQLTPDQFKKNRLELQKWEADYMKDMATSQIRDLNLKIQADLSDSRHNSEMLEALGILSKHIDQILERDWTGESIRLENRRWQKEYARIRELTYSKAKLESQIGAINDYIIDVKKAITPFESEFDPLIKKLSSELPDRITPLQELLHEVIIEVEHISAEIIINTLKLIVSKEQFRSELMSLERQVPTMGLFNEFVSGITKDTGGISRLITSDLISHQNIKDKVQKALFQDKIAQAYNLFSLTLITSDVTLPQDNFNIKIQSSEDISFFQIVALHSISVENQKIKRKAAALFARHCRSDTHLVMILQVLKNEKDTSIFLSLKSYFRQLEQGMLTRKFRELDKNEQLTFFQNAELIPLFLKIVDQSFIQNHAFPALSKLNDSEKKRIVLSIPFSSQPSARHTILEWIEKLKIQTIRAENILAEAISLDDNAIVNRAIGMINEPKTFTLYEVLIKKLRLKGDANLSVTIIDTLQNLSEVMPKSYSLRVQNSIFEMLAEMSTLVFDRALTYLHKSNYFNNNKDALITLFNEGIEKRKCLLSFLLSENSTDLNKVILDSFKRSSNSLNSSTVDSIRVHTQNDLYRLLKYLEKKFISKTKINGFDRWKISRLSTKPEFQKFNLKELLC